MYSSPLTVGKLLEILQRLVQQGYRDAIVFHSDGRSGIDEEVVAFDTVEENVKLASGEILSLGFPIYFP